MSEDWRSLRVNDWVRVVRLPTFQGVPGGGLPACTLRLYKKLIARRKPSRIYMIDDCGAPWIKCKFRRTDGTWEYHWLAMCDDSWIRVKSRNRDREGQGG